MRKEESVAAAALFAIGAWGVYEAYWVIGFGSFQSPGPGFFPFWLSVLLSALALWYFTAAIGRVSQQLWQNRSWRRPLLAGAVMLGYSLLFDVLGFCISTALLFFAWLRLIEEESVLKTISVSVVGTSIAYTLFALLLDVSLPGGVWR